jgi:hypothetical protein
MHARIAFQNLTAADSRQRARCVRTGRFVAWSRAASLRLPGAPAVVVMTPAPVVMMDDPAPVVDVVSIPRAREGGSFLVALVAFVVTGGRRLIALIATAARFTVAGARRVAALIATAAILSGTIIATVATGSDATPPPVGGKSATAATGPTRTAPRPGGAIRAPPPGG